MSVDELFITLNLEEGRTLSLISKYRRRLVGACILAAWFALVLYFAGPNVRSAFLELSLVLGSTAWILTAMSLIIVSLFGGGK